MMSVIRVTSVIQFDCENLAVQDGGTTQVPGQQSEAGRGLGLVKKDHVGSGVSHHRRGR
jgi:hypothetical protein